MKNTKTILTVLGVGALLAIATRPALADVGVSVNLSHGRIGAQVVIGRTPVVVARPTVVTQPVVVAQPTAVNLANNYAYGPFSGYAGQARYFQIYVPAGQTYLTIVTEGGAGESDLLAAPGYWPTSDNTELLSYNDGTSERIEVLYPTAGWWNVVVYGRGAFANVSVLASYWQQDTYLPTYTTYDPYPAGKTNIHVHLAWGAAGCERPYGGWIPFIRNRLAQRKLVVRHNYVKRPIVLERRVEPRRTTTIVTPRVETRRTTVVTPRTTPRRTTVVTPRVETRTETRRTTVNTPRVENRQPYASSYQTPRTESRRTVVTPPTTTTRTTVIPRGNTTSRYTQTPRTVTTTRTVATPRATPPSRSSYTPRTSSRSSTPAATASRQYGNASRSNSHAATSNQGGRSRRR